MALSLAEQLAPNASKPNPNAWRSLMKPQELADYDAEKYDAINPETGAKDLRKAPLESDRMSRDNRLVPYLENDSDEVSDNLAPAYPSPEENLRAARYTRALEEIKASPQPCLSCGLDFSDGEAKVAILTFAECKPPLHGELPLGFMYCRQCWDALGVVLDPDPWFTSLPKRDRQVWLLLKQGLTEREVADKLTVGTQRLTQQVVSEIKLRIVRSINERRRVNAAKKREMKYGQWVQ
jgi:hypothetical protein